MKLTEQKETRTFKEISKLMLDDNKVIYLDFENVKNSSELLDYLKSKAKRLKFLKFTKSQIFKILIVGDNLEENILTGEHFKLIKRYLVENLELILIDTKAQ